MQFVLYALFFALATAGSNKPASIAIIAITTSNSINVNAYFRLLHILVFISEVRQMSVAFDASPVPVLPFVPVSNLLYLCTSG